MSYYDEIDEIGEQKENVCGYCGNPCDGGYCSEEHKKADL